MDIGVVVTSIFVMAIIIGFGSLLATRTPITNELKIGLMFIIINLAVPSIILNGVFSTEITEAIFENVITIFFISIIYHLIGLIFGYIFARLFRFKSRLSTKLAILASMGNSGFIGIPLCATIFGPTGGFLAAIFDAGLDVIIFSLVVYLLQSEGRFQLKQLKALLNPPLIAITFGLTAASTGFTPPIFLKQLTEMLSAIAAPLAMLYIGMLIPPLFKARGIQLYKGLWMPLCLRLLIIPIVTITLVGFLSLDGLIKNVVIILSAMPTFMLATVLFSKYTNDEETAVVTTIYSTILSLLTIPLIAFISSYIS
ncbi:AEC family transporter [Aquibacillus koreensis]|uniref:AEC family transporter n=1 Tax=Aquibacillus koreensis TaxID=279446 RepID=A0A9X4AJ25_9BACI|nr:AEC family transporter [Aquibacillus koreensis]MCT2536335.1 AEC family transporter [Aquibacillus koreensis]MDC3421314.1 AEC family transporter [Aquibacillus koreensis]